MPGAPWKGGPKNLLLKADWLQALGFSSSRDIYIIFEVIGYENTYGPIARGGSIFTMLIVQAWRIVALIPYARNPRKNDKAVERMVAAIREYGLVIPAFRRKWPSMTSPALRMRSGRRPSESLPASGQSVR